MGSKLENYISFLQEHHLTIVTNYFVNNSKTESFIISNKKNHEEELTYEFKQLLKSIKNHKILKENKIELQKFKNEIKDAVMNENKFASKYISFLKKNKETLIHFIPFYSNDLKTSVDIMEELETLFSKLELAIIEQLNITFDNSIPEYSSLSVLDKTKQKLKKTTEELKLSEQQLLETQKIAHVGSFIWDIPRNDVSVTKELLRVFEKESSEEISILAIENEMTSKSRKAFKKNLRHTLKVPGAHESEYTIRTKDGKKKYINIRSYTIHNDENQAIQIIGVVMDITSLKKAELELNNKIKENNETNKKLKNTQEKLEQTNKELDEKIKLRTRELFESNQQYLTFIKMSSEGIWRYALKDIDYINTDLPIDEQVKLLIKHAYVAESNDKMANFQGYKNAKEFIEDRKSKSVLYNTDEEERPIFIKKFVENNYRITHITTKGKNHKGELRYLESSIIGIVEDNKLISAWGIQSDITEKTLSEKLIKRSEKRYRFLADNIPIIFWTATPSGYLDYGNNKWFEYTGSKEEDFKNIDWTSFIHPEDLDETKKSWKNSIETGKVFQHEYRLRDARGNYRWHLGRSYPLKNNSGEIRKWMGTSVDINDQKMYSQNLDLKNKELNKINNELDNFTYTVSHDLKSPVANIEGLLVALKDSMPEECESDENIKGIMNMMTESVEKFKTKLLEFIDLAKAQKRGEETAENNKLTDILESVKPDLSIFLQESDAEIKTDFSNCTHIHFNKKNLQSIFYNLLSNALKYSSKERESKIKITSKTTKNYKILIVEDNGLGFDSHHVKDLTSERLFKNIEGSGVGLYLLKRIMDNEGGKIEIESKKGEGSRFTIYFPLQDK